MIHLRIVSRGGKTAPALEVLESAESVCNVVLLEGAARRPDGDLILADVAREDASVVISGLRELGISEDGSISLDEIDTQLSEHAEIAVERAKGAPADAVVWEEVEARTNENVELSGTFLAFMVMATLLAGVGIYEDSAILIVGAMVVGPEFGPLAGFCVAAVHKRRELALRSGLALALGFPLAITAVYLATLAFKATGLFTDDFSQGGPQPGQHHQRAGLLHLLRRRVRGRGRDAQPEHGQVGRADRRADLRHYDPRRRQHRRLRGLPGRRRLARQRGPARDQPRLDNRRRDRCPVRAAAALPAPQAAPPGGRGPSRAQTDEPSDDQISTFVLIFSTTASVNSVVVAWPPRSNVFTPPAVVSSVAS
jgi:hypothetical protein